MLRAATLITALAFSPAVALAQQPCTGDARHVVNEVYRVMLERSADRDSDQFVQRLSSGNATVRDIVREVAKSPEHTSRFLNTESREAQQSAVATLYRHILGRNADPSGLQANSDRMAAEGVNAMVDTLVDSAEYQQSFGDFGVPGVQGLRYCDPNRAALNRRGYPRRSEVGASGTTAGATLASEAQFDALDRNRNGRIERNEWNGTPASFDALDVNGNNVLSRLEAVSTASAASDEFNSLDLNRDGRLTIQEWNWNRRTFDQQDANRDGAITQREFTGSPVTATGR